MVFSFGEEKKMVLSFCEKKRWSCRLARKKMVVSFGEEKNMVVSFCEKKKMVLSFGEKKRWTCRLARKKDGLVVWRALAASK